PDSSFTPLTQRHVDTGMGFERAVAIIQGTKNLTDFSGTISNYETDVFSPIFDEIEKMSGTKYGSTLPTVGQALSLPGDAEGSRSGRPTTDHEQEEIDVAFRVIADHIRALSFAIADGIIPSNEGRGYVLRRVLRRAIRYGRTLDFHEPFFFKLVDVVAKTMGDVFPEIRAKQLKIKETIEREEEAFNKTLDTGIQEFFNSIIRSVQRLSTTSGLGERMILEMEPYGFGTHKGSMTNVYNLNKPLPTVKLNVAEATGLDYERVLGSRPRISAEHAFRLYDTCG